jgi:hypothetical protein
MPITPVWAVTGGGTITQSGLYSAVNAGGPFTVSASVGTIVGTALVTVNPIPVFLTIQAEDYTNMLGIQKETTTDAGGGQDVGYTDPGDWMDYLVTIPEAGAYTVNFRVASQVATGKIELRNQAGVALATLAQGNTGGWQTWVTKSVSATLPAGAQTLRIYYIGAGLNINWFEIKPAIPQVLTTVDISVAKVLIAKAENLPCKAVTKDQFGEDVLCTLNWTSTGGTITTAGIFSSTVEGIFKVNLTATYGAVSLSKSVDIEVKGTAPTKPDVDFTMPTMGTGNAIPGILTGVADPTKYKVVICVSGNMNTWYDKTHIYPNGFPNPNEVIGVPILADGTFNIFNWAGLPGAYNPYDLVTPYIGLWVVPQAFDVTWPNFMIEGVPIPQKLTDGAICKCIKGRNNDVYKYAELNNEASVRIYPNPATDMVTVESGNSDFYSIEIHSSNGALLLTQQVTSNETELNVSSLENGLYYITLRGSNHTITKSLIVN